MPKEIIKTIQLKWQKKLTTDNYKNEMGKEKREKEKKHNTGRARGIVIPLHDQRLTLHFSCARAIE